MLQVLLVDDEPLELRALRDHVDWNSMGIETVMTAENGQIAYEMVLEKQPDIVITDVTMPVMDGISLARKIGQFNRKIKVVFLSGYDEFSYVKSAMEMGAVDYLLKPFTGRDIEAAIRKVKEELERESLFSLSLENLERQTLERLCVEGDTKEALILDELSRVRSVSSQSGYYGLAMMFGISGRNVSEFLMKHVPEIHTAWQNGGTLTVILRGYADPQECGRKIQKQLQELTGQTCSGVWLEKRYLKDHELRSSYGMLKTWESGMFYEPAGTLRGVRGENAFPPSEVRELTDSAVEETVRWLIQLFPYEEEDAAKKKLEQLLLSMKTMQLSEAERERCFQKIFSVWKKRQQLGNDSTEMLDAFQETLGNCQCADELKQEFLALLHRLRTASQEKEGGRNAFVVRKVREYVQKHYNDAMTIEAIADEIHLSVNYVRSIFKDQTGQTILEYVTDYRFAMACELLKNPALRVKDVANMVGYENVSYFGTIFTKRYGMTPNEYRKEYI